MMNQLIQMCSPKMPDPYGMVWISMGVPNRIGIYYILCNYSYIDNLDTQVYSNLI